MTKDKTIAEAIMGLTHALVELNAASKVSNLGVDKKELSEIFEGSQGAISIMDKVFKQHKNIETVIVNPDSWVGKELLTQTKRLIDLRSDLNSLASSISSINSKNTGPDNNIIQSGTVGLSDSQIHELQFKILTILGSARLSFNRAKYVLKTTEDLLGDSLLPHYSEKEISHE